MALQFPLIASAILGTAYSVPPFRLKRFPFLAALRSLAVLHLGAQDCAGELISLPVLLRGFVCQGIIVVRGVVVNMGFYYYIGHALGVAGACIRCSNI